MDEIAGFLFALCSHYGLVTLSFKLGTGGFLLVSVPCPFASSLIGSLGASRVVLVVNNKPVNAQEKRVPSLGLNDTVEEGTATHSGILDWRSPRTEEPGRLQSMRLHRVRHD